MIEQIPHDEHDAEILVQLLPYSRIKNPIAIVVDAAVILDARNGFFEKLIDVIHEAVVTHA